MPQTKADILRAFRARKAAAGWVEIRIWVPNDPEMISRVRAYVKALAGPFKPNRPGAD